MKYLQSIYLSAVLGFWLSFSTAFAAEVDQVEMPYPTVLECFQIDNAKKVRAYGGNVKGLKFMVMEIDTNEDGERDGMLFFPIFSHEEGAANVSVVPSHVILDTNYDGVPDKAYFDRTRKGECDSLVEVPITTLLRDSKKEASYE